MFLEKNTFKDQCWETSRDYKQFNGSIASSSPEGICWIFVCVQMGLGLSSGVRWHRYRARYRAAYTCQWPFPWHSWWLVFVSSIGLRGVSSSISSLLSELLLSLWWWVTVNNCSTKCNILGQNHATGYEKSENRVLCGCSWYRSSWRSWRSESFPVRRLRAFFPSQPTEFRLSGGLYSSLWLGQFTKSRQTEAVWSAGVVNPLANWIFRTGFNVFVIGFSYQLCWVMDPSCIHEQREVWDHSSDSEEEL